MIFASLEEAIESLSNPTPTRGTMFCRQCGYCLDHLTKHECPECGTSFDPKNPATFQGSPTRSALRFLPAIFFVIHGIAVVVFALNQPAIAGPNVDADALVWILWLWIDLPLSCVWILFAEDMASNAGGVATIVIIGGLQWAFWGWLLQRAIERHTTHLMRRGTNG